MMDIFEFFVFPVSIFSTGLIMCLFLLFVTPQEMEQMHGDVQIGIISKQEIMSLSQERRNKVAKIIAVAALICSLSAAIIAWLYVSLSPKTLLAFLCCLFLQVIVFIGFGVPFYRKMLLIVRS